MVYYPISLIPLANIDELNEIWDADKRYPTLSSRRRWALARNLEPTLVNQWFWSKRNGARKKKIALNPEQYDLPVGNPPEIPVKSEPTDRDSLPRFSSPSSGNDASSRPCSRPPSPASSVLSSPLPFSSEKSLFEPESLGTSLPPSDDSPTPSRTPPRAQQSQFHQLKQSPISYCYDTGTTRPRISINVDVDPACYSILSLDGKLYTPDGYQVIDSDPEADHGPIHVVQTTTPPNHFPNLSELSPELDYLPPLSLDAGSLQPIETQKEHLFDLPLSAMHHTWYRRRIDSSDGQYDAIVDMEFGLDTETIMYHAFQKHLITRWTGDDGWLIREELYIPGAR
ncbi:hypothetical protein BT96DRAFT_1023734 [Gymnopus androsaceus JB14]|uniref:Homeobox domain-containing protein n=1 Tax=Gymnopus androsaceus JB14 TaxID=1447944 RepID=A0A6A4H1N7_9AGAR|nr:hypothetical protein BT96DRAFT_1023734 [Gymnopus androsaceus JB14]